MELQNTVKEALNALYHHPDDAVRMQADRWLQEFQRTIDAWQVSDNLLHDSSSNQETLIFCSQTLRSKVQRDFEELPSEAFRPLRDSLNSLLTAFHKGPPKVRTQISLAVAALAVHVPAKDWGDGGIVNWLRDEMNSHPECIPSFLELLRVLPEEAFNYKIAARPDRRRQFEKELASLMEVALDILRACLNISELTEQVLEAFASWLRLRHRIPSSTLASHPLVLTALSSLSSDILLEASVNVISELIHYTAARNSGGVVAHMPLIQVIVPQVMSLKSQLRDSSKDEEDVKAIARLFADMGDSYLELIANGSDESMVIVHALLEVASHPEYDIASMTFNFWHNLQIYLIERDSYVSFGNEASIEAERNRRLLVSFRVQYPQDYADLSREDLKDFKKTRYDVADVLIDAALVLGGEATLKILYMKLVEPGGSSGNGEHSNWRSAEAALYCIRAISDYVSVTEAEVMPQVMYLLPKLPHQPQLLTTVCLTIGAYSKWLDAAPTGLSFLPSLIDILVSGMNVSEDTAAAAALAFRHICNGIDSPLSNCGKKLCGSLDGLFHIYQRAMIGEGTFKVSAEDSLHLVEALSVVITELPSDHAKKALEVLCLPAVTPLQEVINQGPLVLGQTTARELTVHIDRLANIFRYVNHPEAVADAVQRLWPIFKAIFDIRAWDMRTMESLCRACKNAVRTSKRFMGLTIGAMLEEIQALYKQHHQSCFLYLSSEVIKIFGSDPSCADYLKILIESLFSHTICLLKTIQDFTSRPDIADDCFLLASRCIRYCPDLEASNSILTFLSDIFDISNSSQGEKYTSIRDNVIIPRGPTITRILVASLTGALPSSRLETVIYAVLSLTRAYRSRALEWTQDSVSLIPSTAATEAERLRFLRALSEVVSRGDVNALTISIEELSEVCRRNRTVQEIVQGALRPLELNLVNGVVV
ncbi:hypothetical protein RHGRI_024256 [Rhododendron griersonianum]|uniref:Importin N-terminal domain-containing protein n=1 Tax=Rhododendron griersonianum TaxID=479676 RepID=A0AAV6JB36_9ERIC|nr:hypothetical protein RHGRI_024256 [Rhododendron griersonianum]